MTTKATILKYISESYRPIRITAPIDEWMNLMYINPIFEVYVKYYDDTNYVHAIHDIGEIKSWKNLIFTSSYFPNTKFDNIIKNYGLTYLVSMLGGDIYKQNEFVIDLYNRQDATITFDTKGLIPNRWIRMMADFAFKHATIDDNSSFSYDYVLNYWSNRIELFPEDTLDTMIMFCDEMMNYNIRLEVLRSPFYSKKEYMNVSKMSHNQENYIDQLAKQIWMTCDGRMSAPVEIFFDKCKKYTCLYCPKEQTSDPFAINDEGISFEYINNLPWMTRKHERIVCAYNSREYRPNQNVSCEEIVMLNEILKKEGAETKLTPFFISRFANGQ